MNIFKAIKRDRKIQRRKYGHVTDGRSVFVIKETERQRAEKIKNQRLLKERIRLGEE
jgi:hypothetical protein